MRFPLRYQIMLPLLAVAVASLVAVGAINASLATRKTRAQIERQLQGVVRVLTTTNFPLTDTVLRQMKNLSSAEFVLVDSAGKPHTSTIDADGLTLPTSHMVASSNEVVLDAQIAVGDERYYHTSLRLARRLRAQEAGVLHVLFPRDQYLAAWRAAFLPPLWVGAATVVAVALVAHLLAGRISRATSRLGKDVLQLAGGDFTAVELPARDDELRDLTEAVNQTATRLSDFEEQVRRTEQVRTVALLGAGLAHEMRNAATGCQMAVDLHAENCQLDSSDETLDVARRQLRLMESRLQRFLGLGKQSSEVVLQEVDLAELVEDLLALVRPAAQHAGVELEWLSPEGNMMIRGDAEGLSQAIVNLLVNAIEAVQKPDATGLPRRVSVCVDRTEGGQLELEVSDTGPGPADGIATTLFDPFVTNKTEGVGLGLAVVKQVVAAHGGTIRWRRDDGWTRFSLLLPPATKG